MKTVTRGQVGTAELVLPPRVQEALGQLVASAKEGGTRNGMCSTICRSGSGQR